MLNPTAKTLTRLGFEAVSIVAAGVALYSIATHSLSSRLYWNANALYAVGFVAALIVKPYENTP